MSASWPAFATVPTVADRGSRRLAAERAIPEEVPISLTFNGSAYAVMMATPEDLEDFAIGFAFTEEIIEDPSEIESLEVLPVDGGIEARMWLKAAPAERHLGRRRRIVGPTGCGLCGAESILEALRPLPRVQSSLRVAGQEILAAMEALSARQTLNQRTRAVHAAALWRRGEGLIVREDVGRHNALDKVIGAAKAAGTPAADAMILLTSRVSVELVQKTARLGAPIIAAISAPTALALRLANDANITLAAVVRADGFELFANEHRITCEG